MARIQRSSGRFTGRSTLRYVSGPSAGTATARGIFTTRSGVPSAQPLANVGVFGAFERSPDGIPFAIHFVSVAICASVSRRSSANSAKPSARTACHGGMYRVPTTSAISSPCRFTSSNDSSANGADCPGRWHTAQLLKMMGATSAANVGAAGTAFDVVVARWSGAHGDGDHDHGQSGRQHALRFTSVLRWNSQSPAFQPSGRAGRRARRRVRDAASVRSVPGATG